MMGNKVRTEREEALQIVSSFIGRCERMQLKFAEGTPQHTLLRNRLKALYIAKALLSGDSITGSYPVIELTDALRPIASVIGKCEKACQKYATGGPQYTKLQGIIRAMEIFIALIEDEIASRR